MKSHDFLNNVFALVLKVSRTNTIVQHAINIHCATSLIKYFYTTIVYTYNFIKIPKISLGYLTKNTKRYSNNFLFFEMRGPSQPTPSNKVQSLFNELFSPLGLFLYPFSLIFQFYSWIKSSECIFWSFSSINLAKFRGREKFLFNYRKYKFYT
jgi:hypothetical protein